MAQRPYPCPHTGGTYAIRDEHQVRRVCADCGAVLQVSTQRLPGKR